MCEKSLELKTAVRNILLRLNAETSKVTGKESLYASLRRISGYVSERLTFTYSETDECYLNIGKENALLWMGRTCFYVSTEDVNRIASIFCLRINYEDGVTPESHGGIVSSYKPDQAAKQAGVQ